MRRGLLTVGGVVGAAVLAWSCTGLLPHSDCLDYGLCEGLAGEAGVKDGGNDGPPVVIPPNCDLTKSVKDSPDCVDDGVGVFVSPTGKDGATGTKADPLRSIAEGAAKAIGDGKPRLYVCEGSYSTAVELRSELSIYGSMSCAWAYSETISRKACTNTCSVSGK